jgi:hypothetical protein
MMKSGGNQFPVATWSSWQQLWLISSADIGLSEETEKCTWSRKRQGGREINPEIQALLLQEPIREGVVCPIKYFTLSQLTIKFFAKFLNHVVRWI